MATAHSLILFAQVWLAAGGLIACLFLAIGIDRIDPAARRAYAFRLLLVPGVILLWPLVIVKWVQRERAR